MKRQGGFMIYTYEGGHGNYTLNDHATYNRGAVMLNLCGRGTGETDCRLARKLLSEHFRKYGRRIIIVDPHGTGKNATCRVEVYFRFPELPTDEDLDRWFKEIKKILLKSRYSFP